MKILKKKTQHELALQIVANYLIGKDAICKASTVNSMTFEQMTDALDHLALNTVTMLTAIVGVNGLIYYSNKYELGVGKL